MTPFDAEQTLAHQEAWAKHLGVPGEHEDSVGTMLRPSVVRMPGTLASNVFSCPSLPVLCERSNCSNAPE